LLGYSPDPFVSDPYKGIAHAFVLTGATMANFLWYGGSGDLAVASNWQPPTPTAPGSTDDVTLTGTGTLLGSGAYQNLGFWDGALTLIGSIATGSTSVHGIDPELTIADGGSLNSGPIFIGTFGQSGGITVDGAGSILTCNDWLHVADGGTGILTVQDGGSAITIGLYLGTSSDGDGSLVVDNATVAVSNEAWIGLGGTGTLTVSNGGTFSADHAFVGANSGQPELLR
jgi:T5SS/PEP-CTERM-associated repeat protein